MRSKRQQQQSTRRIRRERRRLGRFVAFSEMLTDLTPKPLIDKSPSSGEPERATRPEANHLIELPCGSNPNSTGQSAPA